MVYRPSTHSSVFLFSLIFWGCALGGGKCPSKSIHSPTNAVTILVQSSTVGISRCSASSAIVCHTLGNGVGIICRTSTPRAMNGIWSSWTPHAALNWSCPFSVSGRNGVPAVDCWIFRPRIRDSIFARLWYAQCVVLKYDGTCGFGAPSKSRRRNSVMELKLEWYVDIAAWGVASHSSARDLES